MDAADSLDSLSALGPRDLLRAAPICTASSKSFSMAASWLSTCLDSHESCQRSVVADLLTRILDVSSSSFGPDTVRLIDSKDISGDDDQKLLPSATAGGRMK
jgi:hypothetical protein